MDQIPARFCGAFRGTARRCHAVTFSAGGLPRYPAERRMVGIRKPRPDLYLRSETCRNGPRYSTSIRGDRLQFWCPGSVAGKTVLPMLVRDRRRAAMGKTFRDAFGNDPARAPFLSPYFVQPTQHGSAAA